jgi:hypothetical protein
MNCLPSLIRCSRPRHMLATLAECRASDSRESTGIDSAKFGCGWDECSIPPRPWSPSSVESYGALPRRYRALHMVAAGHGQTSPSPGSVSVYCLPPRRYTCPRRARMRSRRRAPPPLTRILSTTSSHPASPSCPSLMALTGYDKILDLG